MKTAVFTDARTVFTDARALPAAVRTILSGSPVPYKLSALSAKQLYPLTPVWPSKNLRLDPSSCLKLRTADFHFQRLACRADVLCVCIADEELDDDDELVLLL